MCGRFVSSNPPERIAEYFGASFEGDGLPANFNVAPTNDVYGVVADRDGQFRLETFHWGLVPSWAKDIRIGSKMINARAETIAEKSSFKGVFRKHRVIIPMDGFYEWQQGSEGVALTKSGKPSKQPFFIHRTDGEPLAVAGIWTTWRDKATGPDAPWLHSCSIITTTANATMSPVHDRMPVMLPASAWSPWLDPDNDDIDALLKLLVPAPETLLTMHKVSTEVNNVRNREPGLIDQLGA